MDYRDKLTSDQRAALIKKVRESFAERRSRGEIEGAVEEKPVGGAEALDELEQDANAGRTLKWDLRLSPEEKVAWSRAAQALGLTASEFVRDTVNTAADEVLAPKPLLQ